MTLKNIGEFGLIGKIKDKFEKLTPKAITGIGDDCAVIPLNETHSYVITTDMLIEGQHFLIDSVTPYELGHKTLAVNLSDIAAMGAKPYATLLSIALSSDITPEWCDSFIAGYHSLSAAFGVALIGGDTTSAPKGAVAISVTAMGIVPNNNIKKRDGAAIGDIIAVTSTLGGSSMALKMILANQEPPQELRQLHYQPNPHINEGVWLGKQQCVTSMMDISDGIASDLGHICTLSHCGADIELEKVPTHPKVLELCNSEGWDTTDFTLSGGEEYTLLLTVSKEHFAHLSKEYRDKFGATLYPIGRCCKGDSINFINSNGENQSVTKGFTHF